LLKAEYIHLRTLQPTDVGVILKWENNPDNWKVSGTKQAFTQQEITDFVNAEHNLSLNEQIRYVICLNENSKPIGTIDLFEFDAKTKTVGIGILIAEEEDRNKGYALAALNLITDYCRNERSIVHLFCNIAKDNKTSIRLFEKCGFKFIKEHTLFNQKVNYYEL